MTLRGFYFSQRARK